MIERVLKPIAFSEDWGRQMRFIAGPRQTGKTTMAKSFLKEKGFESLYYNWDHKEIRTSYRRGIQFLEKDLTVLKRPAKPWVCFDEIHKMPKFYGEKLVQFTNYLRKRVRLRMKKRN